MPRHNGTMASPSLQDTCNIMHLVFVSQLLIVTCYFAEFLSDFIVFDWCNAYRPDCPYLTLSRYFAYVLIQLSIQLSYGKLFGSRAVQGVCMFGL